MISSCVYATPNRSDGSASGAHSWLPERAEFDFDGYLASLDFVRFQPELRDRDSFGLVAVLRKTASARDMTRLSDNRDRVPSHRAARA
jgi:hypothetical protein